MFGHKKYQPEESLELLKKEDSKTINYWLLKLRHRVYGKLKNKGLSNEDIEELLLDTITIFIEKLRHGEYRYTGAPIIAYLIKVSHYRTTYYIRKKSKSQRLEDYMRFAENTEDTELPPAWEFVEMAMEQLNSSEKQLIQLTYFEGLKDKEIVDKNLTKYKNIDSLKSQRYKCIRKLIELVKVFNNGSVI